ncbi:uncharacterized protein [Fopius arisanus]|uniref:DUF4485 domain-containing protein n=2 Tax=Fopius arisanus TaxID=64838 RepID=A0A9R1U158_9HYME|nr:PREDICTED: uncharacterized protein LOC105267842 [Fopius arisanus]
MTRVYKEEFRNSLVEIASHVVHIASPHDRVRIVEWCRRLAGISSDNINDAKKRNDYIQLLKIMVRGGQLRGIFRRSLPGEKIPPLGEAIGINLIEEVSKDLPRPGPIAPVISKKTLDGTAYIAINKIHDKGLLCYMAVTPDGTIDDSEDDDNSPIAVAKK